MVALGVVELQGAGERGGDLVGGVPGAALLEPDDVVDREPGEGGELLAAEPDGPPATADGQAGVGGGEACAPGLQQPAELGVLCRHAPILASRAPVAAWYCAVPPAGPGHARVAAAARRLEP